MRMKFLDLMKNLILIAVGIWLINEMELYFDNHLDVLINIVEICLDELNLAYLDSFHMDNCDYELYKINNNLSIDKPSFNCKVDNHNPNNDDNSEHEFTAVNQMNPRLREELLQRHQDALEAEVDPIDPTTLTDEQVDELLSRTEPGLPNFPDQPEYVEHPITRNIVRRETVYTQDPHTGELVRLIDPDRPFDN